MTRQQWLAVGIGGGALLCLACGGLCLLGLALPTKADSPPVVMTRAEKPVKAAPDPVQAKSAPVELAEDVLGVGQVWADYANLLNAKNIYHKRKYLVVGVVQSVTTSLGKPVVRIRGDEFGLQQIAVHLPGALKQEASQLQKDQVVTFFGEISGSGQNSISMNASEMALKDSDHFRNRVKRKGN